MYFPLFVGVLCLSLFCYASLCVHSNFAIILKRKRKLVAWLLLSYRYIVTINVLWLVLTVPWVCLHYVIVVFPDHTNLLFANRDWVSHQASSRMQYLNVIAIFVMRNYFNKLHRNFS